MSNTVTFPSTGDGPSAATKMIPKSKKVQIEQWFFKPLDKYKEHESFIILMVCLPLYEKYLKQTGKIKKTEKFTKGHKVFECIGNHICIPSDLAFEFWKMFRNGLCHQAMPKKSDYKFRLVRDSEKIVDFDKGEKIIVVNAFKFRDKIRDLILSKPSIFRDKDYPFAIEFKE